MVKAVKNFNDAIDKRVKDLADKKSATLNKIKEIGNQIADIEAEKESALVAGNEDQYMELHTTLATLKAKKEALEEMLERGVYEIAPAEIVELWNNAVQAYNKSVAPEIAAYKDLKDKMYGKIVEIRSIEKDLIDARVKATGLISSNENYDTNELSAFHLDYDAFLDNYALGRANNFFCEYAENMGARVFL